MRDIIPLRQKNCLLQYKKIHYIVLIYKEKLTVKLPFKKKKEVVFKTVEPYQGFILRNQESERTDFRDIDIEDYLADMFVTPDQFVVLTAPKAQHKVRYVQACTHDGEIEVELGIEEKGTHLYYKNVTVFFLIFMKIG